MKTQKGITLIALIITIIVMLILVGVTIRVAKESELFSTTWKLAEDMKEETEIEKELSYDIPDYSSDYEEGNGPVRDEDKNEYTHEELLEVLGITDYTGEYDGTWEVIERKDGKTKLVSTKKVATYRIGYEDPKAIAAIEIAGTTPTKTEKLERAIWSYKNAVNSLNSVAQEATGIPSARSITIEDIYGIVGEENIDKGTAYGRVYNYYYDTTSKKVYSKYITGNDEEGNPIWSTPFETERSSQTFVNDEGNTVVVDSEGDEIMCSNGYFYANLTGKFESTLKHFDDASFWLASTFVSAGSYYAEFQMRCFSLGNIANSIVFGSDGYVPQSNAPVRAIVSF